MTLTPDQIAAKFQIIAANTGIDLTLPDEAEAAAKLEAKAEADAEKAAKKETA